MQKRIFNSLDKGVKGIYRIISGSLGKIGKRKIIAVAGESCSGKGFYSERLCEIIRRETRLNSEVIDCDNYFIDKSEREKLIGRTYFGFNEKGFWDYPESFDWSFFRKNMFNILVDEKKEIRIPNFDLKVGKRRGYFDFKVPDVVVLNGLWILNNDYIKNLLGKYFCKIFIKAHENEKIDEGIRYLRRLSRDIKEKKQSEEHIEEIFWKHVVPLGKKFVKPSEKNADFVVVNPFLKVPKITS